MQRPERRGAQWHAARWRERQRERRQLHLRRVRWRSHAWQRHRSHQMSTPLGRRNRMRRLTLSLMATLLLVASALALHAGAAGTMIESAGGSGAFASASTLLGIDLSASTFGSGVSFNTDGTV